MSVWLLFPPSVDPRAPYLALPSLAASLRAEGVEVRMRDLSLEGFLQAVHPERVPCRRLAGRVPEALRVLRDAHAFHDPNAFNGARTVLDAAAAAAGQSLARPVRYGITPIRYDVAGVDPMRLRDLLDVTADDRANLFAGLYASVVEEARAASPRVVGVAIQNGQQMIPGLLLARRLKAAGCFTVIGGALFTKFVDALHGLPAFFEAFCDALVAYEGETALRALASGDGDLSRVPNLLYLERGEVRGTALHVEDVSSLPTPDFEGLPLDAYLAPAPVLPILTGKGCYFNRCRFCDIPYINRISRKAYRVRPARLVADDMTRLSARHGARHFVITDEALSPRLLCDLADALAASDCPPRAMVGYARLEPGFTPEVCQKLRGMGLRKLFFGLESGSQASLDRMDKGVRLDHARAVLRNCRGAGMAFHLFTMLGLPDETEAEARETLAFLLDAADAIDHPSNSFDVHRFHLEPRTPWYAEAQARGLALEGADREFPVSSGAAWGMDAETVRRLIEEFYGTLRARYSTWHDAPLHLWPAFEEYAALYATWFDTHPFAWRTSLPPDGDPQRWLLRWSAMADVERRGRRVTVRTPLESATLDAALYRALCSQPGRVDAILDRLCAGGADRAQARRVVNKLIASWLLELAPA